MMGLLSSITKTLFGGSSGKNSSTSSAAAHNESGNLAFPYIESVFSPTATTSNVASSFIGNLLGTTGGANRDFLMENFRKTPGYQFAMDEGLRAINGSQAGRSRLMSGETLKALQKYGTGLADQTYGSYMDRLFNYGNQGLEAGRLISGAGQYSVGDSSSASFSKGKNSSNNGGLGNFIGAILASDPAVKKNVIKIGELSDGLGVYQFDYIWDDDGTKNVGVMADEVEALRPHALGPVIDGIMTVDYSKLGDA